MRRRSESDGTVQPVFPEADPYPAVRVSKHVIHRATRPDGQTIGDRTSVAIQKYVDAALAATHTRRPTPPQPLPRVRAARGSQHPMVSDPLVDLMVAELGGPHVWTIDDDDEIGDEFGDDDDDTVEAQRIE